MTDATTISISCDDCELQGSSACEDCLVSFVLGREPDDAVVVDVEEARAMRMLSLGQKPAMEDIRQSSMAEFQPR